MLRFSIITIEKEYPDGLLRTLQSVASQVIPKEMAFSNLICEGKPGTAQNLIQELGISDRSRICSSSDSGLYNGMNRGLNCVSNGWVLFLNAGDTLESNGALGKIFQILSCSNSAVVQFKSNYSDGSQRPLVPYSRLSLFLGRNMHIHPALCINLDVIGDVRFDERFRIAADYKMVNELIKVHRFQFSSEVISNFEGGGISSSSTDILIREMNLVRNLVSPRLIPKKSVTLWNLFFSYRIRKKMRVK